MDRLVRIIGGAVLGAMVVFAPWYVAARATAPAPAYQWATIYAPTEADAVIWRQPAIAAGSGLPVAQWWYWKRPEQTHFVLCGHITGDGELLFNVGDLGDGVIIHAPAGEDRCVTTDVPWGGGGAPIPVGVYLLPDPGASLTLTRPNVFAGQPEAP